MTKSLQVLEAWGVLEPVVKGMPRTLASGARKQGAQLLKVACPKVAVFTHQPYDRLSRVDRLVCDTLQRQLRDQGRRCLLVQASMRDMTDDMLRCTVANHPADIYVVLSSTDRVARWFRDHRLRAIFVGGVLSPDTGCVISFSGIKVMERALEHLIGLGHRRIVFPRPEYTTGGGRLSQFVRDLFAKNGLPFGSYNMPVWAGGADELLEQLRRSFQVTPPTAIVLWDSSMVLTLWSFLMERSLRCPEDLSVVVLDDHPLFDEMRPQLDVVVKSPKELASRIAKQVTEMAVVPYDSPVAMKQVLLGGKLKVRGSSRELGK